MTKRPYATPTAKRRNIYADDATVKALKDLGCGNISAGVREAVRLATNRTRA